MQDLITALCKDALNAIPPLCATLYPVHHFHLWLREGTLHHQLCFLTGGSILLLYMISVWHILLVTIDVKQALAACTAALLIYLSHCREVTLLTNMFCPPDMDNWDMRLTEQELGFTACVHKAILTLELLDLDTACSTANMCELGFLPQYNLFFACF